MIGRLRGWRIDRITDRKARRPHGRRARRVYGAPDVHSFAWGPILETLRLGPDDRLLDVGCGGGIFLRHALEVTGCRGAGLDHSRDMVRLASRNNATAIAAGRAVIVRCRAECLPFPDAAFTAISCIVVVLFLDEPVRALSEFRRVLDPHEGRAALFTIPPEAKGTPAAPYPLTERTHFYPDEELAELGKRARFTHSSVTRTDIGAQLLLLRV